MAHIPPTVQTFPVAGLTLLRQGKVRDAYALPNHPALLLVVASDRISIFDFVLPALVHGKGEILTALNVWWCDEVLRNVVSHDLVVFGSRVDEYLPESAQGNVELWKRAVVVRKLEMLPIEAIVRGYLTGSGLASYLKTGMVCGHFLPERLTDGARLPQPIFTPSTKADMGHDMPLDVATVCARLGKEPEEVALRLYGVARRAAIAQDILIADTKFEFGRDAKGNLVVADERFTPDSSRFWDTNDWTQSRKQDRSPAPFDKQFMREEGKRLGIHLRDPKDPTDLAFVDGLTIPTEVRQQTTAIYEEIFQRLTGQSLEAFQRTVMGIRP